MGEWKQGKWGWPKTEAAVRNKTMMGTSVVASTKMTGRSSARPN